MNARGDLWPASEALSLGFGGISRVRRATGLSRKAIAKGIKDEGRRVDRADDSLPGVDAP
jgi:hypothetical protein